MSLEKVVSVKPQKADMYVTKRNGMREEVSFDKVLSRIKAAARGLDVNATIIAQKTLARIYNGVHTTELDELSARIAISLAATYPDYGALAAQIAISNHQRNTSASFCDVMHTLADQVHAKTGERFSTISPDFIGLIQGREAEIDAIIVHKRDFLFDYFGFKTLEKQYLLKDAVGKILERPQYMYMRVALALWGHLPTLDRVIETYTLLSTKRFTHATPTLFNAGMPRQQMSSCYLLAMDSDTVSGIYKTLGDCAQISKYAGGIGLHIHNIRAKGSIIRGTNGVSNGIVPMLKVFNDTARYIDQGGGKRNGSFAIYLEPWHADIEDFLMLKRNTGTDEERARDLFYGLWIPDLFMERVEADGEWTLFCPDEAPGLADVWGPQFKELYERYEREGRGRQRISAQKLWFKILDSQIETGTPYLLYKDQCNAKSNQQNLGTIKSSNLCVEVVQYSDSSETAVCNLASINLSTFVDQKRRTFDFEALRTITRTVVRNLNRVIDINYYPTTETERSNMRHRPIGIGIQGLADVFAMMRYPWEGTKALELNQRIFEHMYYAAIQESAVIAQEQGSYSSFVGSPASKGQLQPDLWAMTPLTQQDSTLDWTALRESAAQGLRNSLLIAPMPTASTSQICGSNECFEPFTSNIYTRRTLAGEFVVINKYLMNDLIRYDIWSEELKQKIIAMNGSVQGLDEIPQALQELYKTSYEIKQRTLIDMAAARAPFICQSQSLNLFVANPNYSKLTSMHFYAWKKGLKTGMYYLRTKAPVMAQKFSVDPDLINTITQDKKERDAEKYDADPGCLMCSG
jgi:ribonucleoside-diphosphate reductase alpha chain